MADVSIIQALTSDDDAEIERLVRMLVENDAGTGYIHESIHKDDEREFIQGPGLRGSILCS